MALLGLAEAHLTAGRYQDAISLLEGQTGSLESTTPVDAVLMRLGRAYQLAGQSDDALGGIHARRRGVPCLRVFHKRQAGSRGAAAGREQHVGRVMESETSFSVGLVQASCQDNPQSKPRRSVLGSPIGGCAGRSDHLPPGVVLLPVFLPDRGCSTLRFGGNHSRAINRAGDGARQGTGRRADRPDLRKTGGGAVSQHRCRHRRVGRPAWRVFGKMHIPDDPQYYEKFYFTPGDLGYRTFDTRFARIGVLICWDQWYPEAARLTALKGAEGHFLPQRHRVAAVRTGDAWLCPARRLADDPA